MTASDTTLSKKELRKGILAQRKAMDPEEVTARSKKIIEKIMGTDLYLGATSLCVYMPINREAEADLLIGPARGDGKNVYIPKVTGDVMVFNAYDPKLMIEDGPFHIRESLSEDILEPDDRTLIIMPGSVFDLECHRIGYGGGYYDKYLERYPQCRTIAICFDFQIVDSLPTEDHDISPELVVSDQRIIQRV